MFKFIEKIRNYELDRTKFPVELQEKLNMFDESYKTYVWEKDNNMSYIYLTGLKVMSEKLLSEIEEFIENNKSELSKFRTEDKYFDVQYPESESGMVEMKKNTDEMLLEKGIYIGTSLFALSDGKEYIVEKTSIAPFQFKNGIFATNIELKDKEGNKAVVMLHEIDEQMSLIKPEPKIKPKYEVGDYVFTKDSVINRVLLIVKTRYIDNDNKYKYNLYDAVNDNEIIRSGATEDIMLSQEEGDNIIDDNIKSEQEKRNREEEEGLKQYQQTNEKIEKKIKVFEVSLKMAKTKKEKEKIIKKIKVFQISLTNEKAELGGIVLEGGNVKKEKYWMDNVPEKDDFGVEIKDVFIDGKTIFGSWAFMTPDSFKKYGIRLGVGGGQKYMKQNNGKWLNITLLKFQNGGSLESYKSERTIDVEGIKYKITVQYSQDYDSTIIKVTEPNGYDWSIERMPSRVVMGLYSEIDKFVNNLAYKKFQDGGEIKRNFNIKFGDGIDVVTLNIPLMIRLLEYSKEDARSDMDLHKVTENAIRLSKEKDVLTMDDYNALIDGTGEFGCGGVSYRQGGRIKDSDIQVGSKFELANGEIIEIKRLFKEKLGESEEDWCEYTRSGKTQENKVKSLRIFINNWKKYADGGGVDQNIIDFNIPEWAVNYLLTGDESGLSDKQLDKVKKWQQRVDYDMLSVKHKNGGGVRAKKEYNRDVEKYKWFVVDKKAKRAVSGWEYKSDAEDAKKDYDGDTNYTVYSERMLKIMNIENPKEQWYERRDDGTKYSKGSTVGTKSKERCDTTMPIQSLIFDRKKFSKAKAKRWAKENQYKTRTEVTENSYRMRQSNPKNFKAPFRTITITDGIKAVVACKK